MALKTTHKEVTFGVGDTVKVFQNITEGEKKRLQVFEGMVIGIRGHEENKSFVVRRIGPGQIGIEKIFPLHAPIIEKIEVVRQGTSGVRRGKLYYTRLVSKKEVEKIYRRTAKSNITVKKVVKKAKKLPQKQVKKVKAKKSVKASKK